MYTEDQLALIQEIVPRTLRSLFVLRITLCVVAALLAVVKIALSPPASDFFMDLLTDTTTQRQVLANWFHALNLLFSGLLASVLALVIATFFIQARIRGHAEEELANTPAPAAPVESGSPL